MTPRGIKAITRARRDAPRLAGEIKLVREGGHFEMTVDGEPFPWYIGAGSLQVSVNRGDAPGVALTLMAERVEVVDALDAPEADGCS